jgi:NosR/NirI family nitrous oxide reductase transcriptional regulator
VTIEDGAITAIEVIEHNEHEEKFWGRPVSLIPQRVIDAQSTDVDTVTGATMTSRGIIEAVEDALAQASADA